MIQQNDRSLVQRGDRMRPRYRVVDTGENRCVLHVRGAETEFWCPAGGGYVHIVTRTQPGTLGQQVCDGLRSLGSTLRFTPAADRRLAHLIRRHARKAFAPDRDGYAWGEHNFGGAS